MDDNPAGLECLIRFYINTKYFLKTRLLDEKMFMYQMVKHCKDQGFHGYSDKEINNTWKKLVSKYTALKTKGSTQDRESWKYFEILDSCYEELDFQDEAQSKFSQEMVWFLIESFLKRKKLGKTQKSNGLLKDVHKAFLLSGYLNVTKHDIENKWKNLNLKYEKLKDDPEGLKKFPYLQALRVFHGESKTQLVNMVFTKNLTEMLVECFTKKKISCVIHGYDSDKVLNEIQMKFTELGFYFSKDAIKEKWRNLTTTYKFLLAKKEKTTWIYFNAMRNHFTDDYLLLCGTNKEEICKEGSKPRRLRQRSKSVCARLGKTDSDESSFIVKSPLPDIIISEDNSRNKSVKRPFEDQERSDSPKKRGRPRRSLQKANDGDVQIVKRKLDLDFSEFDQKVFDESKSEGALEKLPGQKKSIKRFKPTDDIGNRPKTSNSPNKSVTEGHQFDDSTKNNAQSTYFKDSHLQQNQDVTSNSTSEAQTLNVDGSNLNKKDEKTTDVTPIAKQLDNELLPFKKRLIIDVVKIDKYITDSKEAKEGTFKFSVTELENQASENDGKTTEQVEIGRSTCETDDKLDKFRPKTFKTYQRLHKNQQSQIDPEVACPTQNVNDIAQNSFQSSARNINSTNNNTNEEQIIDLTKDIGQDTSDSVSNTQEVMETCPDVIPPEHQTEENNLSNVNATDIETSVVYNNISEIVDVCTSNLYPNETEQVYTELIDSEVHDMNTESRDVETEQCYSEDVCEPPEPIVVFRKPLPVAKETVNQVKSFPETPNNLQTATKLPFGKNQILISRNRLNNLTKLQFDTGFPKTSGSSANVGVKQSVPAFRYFSQIIKPATVVNVPKQVELRENASNDDSSLAASEMEPLASGNGNEKNDEFENESVFSEAVGNDGLKDNLLATVIDFQEQNNQEFIEIKNLMKQNNLLQRETNRLLRLLLEKK